MPQPAEVADLVEELLSLYRQAQANINDQLLRTIFDPRRSRRRARLLELRRSVDAELRLLEQQTAAWLTGSFPRVYELGGQQAAGSIGEQFGWTQPAADAVQVLAGDTFDDVLAATTHVRADVKAWIRQEGRRQTALSLIEGRTAEQAGRELARAAAGEAAELLGGPVGLIRYADGSYRTLADYSNMLLRTKTAVAFNTGTLNTLEGFGVGFVEVLDGSGCGWTSHDDGDMANGSIRTVKAAAEQPLAHPRCRRSFIGRPDIESPEQAKRAKPSTTEAQRADQAQAEADRAARIERRAANRRAREQRSTRQPRAARANQPARAPRAERSAGSPPDTAVPSAGLPPAGPVMPANPPAVTDLFALPDGTDVTDLLRPVIDQTVGDLTVALERAVQRFDSIDLTGVIRSDGRPVGRVSRQIRQTPDGTLSVYNALLQIDRAHQGGGFATQYLGHLEDWYRANGVQFIDVHANIDVGGYTWATKGFDWSTLDNGAPDTGTVPGRLRRTVLSLPDGPVRTEGEELLALLEDPTVWGTNRMPTPARIAAWGRRPGDTMWPGKEAMLNSSWHGRKRLT